MNSEQYECQCVCPNPNILRENFWTFVAINTLALLIVDVILKPCFFHMLWSFDLNTTTLREKIVDLIITNWIFYILFRIYEAIDSAVMWILSVIIWAVLKILNCKPLRRTPTDYELSQIDCDGLFLAWWTEVPEENAKEDNNQSFIHKSTIIV